MSQLHLINPRSLNFFPNLHGLESFFDGDTSKKASEFRLKSTVLEYDDRFELSLDVPGISKDDIEIEVKNKTLTIKGERKGSTSNESEKDNVKVHFSEQSYGTFSRSFKLPDSIGDDKIVADYHSGVLTITLPKTPEAAPRKISIAPKS